MTPNVGHYIRVDTRRRLWAPERQQLCAERVSRIIAGYEGPYTTSYFREETLITASHLFIPTKTEVII
jgi:hypothetical protein